MTIMPAIHSLAVTVVAFAIAMTFQVTTASPVRERERAPVHVDKPAAEWTDEERIAARYDPVLIAERNEAHYKEHPEDREVPSASAYSAPEHRTTSITVDGKRNPELLLPHELFEGIVAGVDPDHPDLRIRQRALLAPGLRELGISCDQFWADLSATASDYARTRWSRPKDLCIMRNAALQAAEAKIGRETLYRVFYEVMAPYSGVAEATNDPHPERALLRQARCE